MFFEVCSFIVLVAFLGTVFIRWRYTYWKRRNVSYMSPTFPFGNYDRAYPIGVWLKICYDEFKRRDLKHAGLYIGLRPVYFPIATDFIKNVLQNDFQYFVNRGTYSNQKYDPLSAHLFNLGGQMWREMRTKLTPTFTSGKMKMMFDTLLQCTTPMQEVVTRHCLDETPVMIKEVVSRFTTDVIGSCAFGLDCNSFKDEDAPFRYYGRKIFETNRASYILTRALTTCSPAIARTLRQSLFPKETTNFFLNVVKETIKYRKHGDIQRNDMLQILIELQKKDKEGHRLSVEEMAAQCFVFFIAGFETSSSVSTFCLYELAKNIEIQRKVRDEIVKVLQKHRGQISYESLADMKYLDQVIYETMRIYPTLAAVTRECVKDYHVPGLHKDPSYFKDPDLFDPERFSTENIHNSNPFVFMPFGQGPRNCIGMRFGMMQVKVGLTCLMRDFSFSLSPKTKPLVFNKYALITNTRDPIWLDVKKIT
ncbi:probable cytochrome P450 6a14 isoform X2 [Photinus pyralis]|uniref:probable cytochrome P450 6a14 isoform X2 n=1 Tax=Photinus pyralis TaxID=7054 RepID=UPI001267827C|nr:probable cytochrome P450 6a14 isoform X2 [Photinus pyralis]